jgi:hypothetical protein
MDDERITESADVVGACHLQPAQTVGEEALDAHADGLRVRLDDGRGGDPRGVGMVGRRAELDDVGALRPQSSGMRERVLWSQVEPIVGEVVLGDVDDPDGSSVREGNFRAVDRWR